MVRENAEAGSRPGAQESGSGRARRPVVGGGRRVGTGRVAGRPVRRRPRGPWPLRPGVVPVVVRPAQPVRPGTTATAVWSGSRLLVRRPRTFTARARRVVGVPRRAAAPWVAALRRCVGVVATAVAAGLVVVGLGLLGGVAHEARTGGPAPDVAGSVLVTVDGQRTVVDLARALVPAASPAELSRVADHIVASNALGSERLHPGQVLRVFLR